MSSGKISSCNMSSGKSESSLLLEANNMIKNLNEELQVRDRIEKRMRIDHFNMLKKYTSMCMTLQDALIVSEREKNESIIFLKDKEISSLKKQIHILKND